MAYHIQQFRYYGRNNVNNYPSDISPETLGNGSIFKDYIPIVQLGIQFAKDRGVRFYINGSVNPIYTGYYGLYELDLIGKTAIKALRFDQDQIAELINPEEPLIVDIVYER